MKIPFFDHKSSISSSLSYWFCGVSIALVILLSEGIYYLASNAMGEQNTQRLEDLAFQIATHLDQGMYERYREAQLLATRSEFGDVTVTIAEKEKIFNAIQSTYPQYAWIGLTDNNGSIVAATKGLLRGHDVSTRPWYINANSNINVGDVHDAKLLAKLLPTEDGEPLRFIDLAFPYFDKAGQKKGIVGIHMSWAWAKMIERSVIEPEQRHGRLETMIINSAGVVILGPKNMIGSQMDLRSMGMKSNSTRNFGVGEWADRKDFLIGSSLTQGYASFPGLGWTVIVRQPTKDAFAPVWELRKAVLVMGIGIALLFSLFGRYSARRITRSIRYLSRSARDVADGREMALTIPDDSYPEVDQLWRSLNSLLESHIEHEKELQVLNATLEERVEERTMKLQISKERLKTITDSIPALISYIDTDRKYQFCNNTYEHWYGANSAEAVGKTIAEVLGEDRYEIARPHVDKALRGEKSKFDFDLIVGGRKRYITINYIPDLKDGVVRGFYVMGQDVTDARLLQLALEHEVIHDELTSLPNRRGCMNAIDGAIDRAKRSKNAMAVMFLDLNKFKAINDKYGHATGDEVLVEFAKRLKATVRETDSVARLSGDEFVVVAENLMQGRDNAKQIAENIIAAMRETFPIEGFEKSVCTSIGIAIHESGATTADALLSAADHAMYEAKGRSESSYEFSGATTDLDFVEIK